MEAKNIGNFIATMRKANGMTQKDLADRINVSDKTVSRWERGESEPELSLIPVLAEIFNVSCDELLRGEKKAPSFEENTQEASGLSKKGEKEKKRLLQNILSTYRDRTLLCMGIVSLGFLLAMFFNSALYRSYIGFYVFFLGAAVSVFLQILFARKSWDRIVTEEFQDKETEESKRLLVSRLKKTVVLTVVLLAASLPMIMHGAGAHVGINYSMGSLIEILIDAVILLAITRVGFSVADTLLKKKGFFVVSEEEAKKDEKCRVLKKSYVKKYLIAAVITVLVHLGACQPWNPDAYLIGQKFETKEEFIEFMETPMHYSSYQNTGYSVIYETKIPQSGSHTTYYDEYGREITEEEALREKIYNSDGEVEVEYLGRNMTVAGKKYDKDNVFPITVYTYSDYHARDNLVQELNIVFVILYFVEAAVFTGLYFKKKRTV